MASVYSSQSIHPDKTCSNCMQVIETGLCSACAEGSGIQKQEEIDCLNKTIEDANQRLQV